MHSTNYTEAFIKVSADSRATKGEVPDKSGTIARMQYEMLAAKPYGMTSDDLLFEVFARRNGIAADREIEREKFFAKPQACLRASPLVKQYGWGLHHDADGRVALVGVDTDAYRTLAARADLNVLAGMRSKRAS